MSINALLVAVAVTGAGETVLLDFTSDHCVYCRQMEPTVQRLEAAGYPIRKINVSRQPTYARRFGIQGVPAYVMISNGREVGRVVGRTSYDSLRSLFEQARFRPPGSPDDTGRFQSPDDSSTFDNSSTFEDRSAVTPEISSLPSRETPPRRLGERFPQGPIRADEDEELSPEDRALAATVRLTIKYAGRSPGQSVLDHATGTIIDVHQDEALVLTCGHVFRDSQGKGQITVDMFRRGRPLSVRGELIEFDAEDRDVALVSIRPGVAVKPAPVAPSSYSLRPGQRLFSVGCSNGKQPSVMQSRLMRVNSSRDPQKIDAAGSPIDGRSGGGLFDSDGLLVGVCNGNYVREDEGMYAGLKTVQWQLDRIGQSQVYNRAETAVARSDPRGRREPPFAQLRGQPQRLAGEAAPPDQPLPTDSTPDQAIVILRDARGGVETYTIDHPTREFLQTVKTAQRPRRDLASRAPLVAPNDRDRRTIRGQSRD